MSPDKTSDNPIFMTTLERFHDLRLVVRELATQVALELEHQIARLDELEECRKTFEKEYNEIRRKNEVLFERMTGEDRQQNDQIVALLADMKILMAEHITNQGVRKFVIKWWYPILMAIIGALIAVGIKAWIL